MLGAKQSGNDSQRRCNRRVTLRFPVDSCRSQVTGRELRKVPDLSSPVVPASPDHFLLERIQAHNSWW